MTAAECRPPMVERKIPTRAATMEDGMSDMKMRALEYVQNTAGGATLEDCA